MNDILSRITNKLKNGKTLLILGIVGIILIFSSSFIGEKSEPTTREVLEFNEAQYSENLEKRVKKIVKSITGSRSVSVLITLEGGPKYTYGQDSKELTEAKESENSRESEQKYILVTDAEGNEKALSVYEAYPLIRGVTVVYSGSASHIQNIEDALIASLGITSKRISIINKGGN